ncbi:MAG: hypothetical protein HKL91_01770 [Candidatus Eremiobacteraeota bacterium]|nr:hypothetical protein [Candidatus Eremiobacteraeota bacterium]
MLRRLTLGLAAISVAVAVAACNSSTSTNLNIGPNFATSTLYAANTSLNAVAIFSSTTASLTAPSYQIGGSSTTLNAPQYLDFDATGNLWVANYNASTGSSSILQFNPQATGNVLPFATFLGGSLSVPEPRGLSIERAQNLMAITTLNPASIVPSQLLIFSIVGGSPALQEAIGGSATLLNIPTGAAFVSGNAVIVANSGNATVATYTIPTPSPTPVPTATPVATATPSPSGSPTASPSPVPVATPLNLPPSSAIVGSLTLLGSPRGVAVASNGAIYVADPSAVGIGPAVLVFAANATGNVAPTAIISGSSTGLIAPSDVKIDASGNIYVADSGANKVFVFAPGATGNVAPKASLSVGGTVVGIALSP